MKTRVTKIFKFEMAHKLDTSYSEECRNIHGHSYKLEVTFEGVINKDGMVIDFKKLKEIVQPLVTFFDHGFIDKESFFGMNPTAENMAHWIFDEIRKKTALIIKVKLWETETCFVEVEY